MLFGLGRVELEPYRFFADGREKPVARVDGKRFEYLAVKRVLVLEEPTFYPYADYIVHLEHQPFGGVVLVKIVAKYLLFETVARLYPRRDADGRVDLAKRRFEELRQLVGGVGKPHRVRVECGRGAFDIVENVYFFHFPSFFRADARLLFIFLCFF